MWSDIMTEESANFNNCCNLPEVL